MIHSFVYGSFLIKVRLRLLIFKNYGLKYLLYFVKQKQKALNVFWVTKRVRKIYSALLLMRHTST